MRIDLRIIALTAFAVLFMPALTFGEGETPPAAPKETKAIDAGLSSSADPALPIAAASQAPASGYSKGMSVDTPKVEVFLGYSYLRGWPSLAAGNRFVWLNGGSASVAYNFNRYLGVVGDFGGFGDTQLRLDGAVSQGGVPASGTAYTYLFGPRFSFRKSERLTPFVQVLFGGVHASAVTLSSGCTGAGCTPLPAENKIALTAGGGLDLKVHRHLAIRLFQAEYLMTRFENLNTGSSASQNDMRLSAGVVFRFGGGAPVVAARAALTYSCSVNPAAVFPGDRIAVSGTAENLNPERAPTYTWSVDGGTVTPGVSSSASIDTKGLAIGSYTLKGHVSEGSRPGENADCTASFRVKAFEPPTISCSANPASIMSGESSAITAAAVSPQDRSLTYSYSSTSGSMVGTGATATLVTTGAATGTITVTCNVADDRGLTASATTTVNVAVPVAAAKPSTSTLCSVNFDRDARRPSRVDNEAKACLDEIALSAQQNSEAKLAIVGNAGAGEKGGKKLAAERATNTKAYLVAEKGIDPARIAIYTGSDDGKTASTTLIPAGATLDTSGVTPVE